MTDWGFFICEKPLRFLAIGAVFPAFAAGPAFPLLVLRGVAIVLLAAPVIARTLFVLPLIIVVAISIRILVIPAATFVPPVPGPLC